MMQVALEGDPPTVLDAMREKIWACCQCYSCTMRCRFGNDIAGTVSILRELAVRHGLESAQKVVAPFGRTLTLLMTVGTQISPDMIQPEFFPDWGPRAGGSPQDWNISSDVLRQAVPIDVLQTNRAAWEVSVETSLELFRIYEEAGVVEMVRAVDPDLTEMLIDIIETRREELAEARARYTERSHHDPPPEAPHAER
jgi:heterodisulfide reductase subunit C